MEYMTGNLVSFDIGESRVKIAWYLGAMCKKTVCADLPDNLINDGEIVSMDAMADFLRACTKEHGIPKSSAALILPAPLVFTRNVDVPPMTDAQLGYNLPFEFKDYLTQDKSLYCFDYSVQSIEHDEDGEPTKMRLFACATLKKTIDEYREMFRRAGFRLKLAMPEESAYAALLSAHIGAGGETEDHCIVDIGSNAIRMYIFHGDCFATRRTIALGLRDLVSILSDLRGVDEHLAREHMLHNYENALSEPAVLDLFHRMAIEIMKAVNFYNYNNREQTLRRIHLCGGGASIEQISAAISEMTNLTVHPISALMPPDTTHNEPWLYAKAVGCALQR